MVRQNSASESTQNNSQNPILNTNGLTHHMEWSEHQQETLEFLLEEQAANEEYYSSLDELCWHRHFAEKMDEQMANEEEYYSSLDEPHGVSCNCTECN